jgi:putative oxidoreductase
MTKNLTALCGRVLLVTIFLISGWGKIVAFERTTTYMAEKGIPFAVYFLVAAIIVEIIGGLSVGLGYKARLGAAALFLFLIPTTFLFHNFWIETGLKRNVETIMFLKNLGLMGGFLMVVANGAGKWTVDEWLRLSRYRRSVARDAAMRKP